MRPLVVILLESEARRLEEDCDEIRAELGLGRG
jgi:hypothetical protein